MISRFSIVRRRWKFSRRNTVTWWFQRADE